MVRFCTLPFLLFALPAFAQSYVCQGDDPAWLLTFDDATASFSFPSPTNMDVMLTTQAEGLDWPRAFTLIGERDTAIALLELETCNDAPYRAHVMTQRGQTPILLSGCCVAQE